MIGTWNRSWSQDDTFQIILLKISSELKTKASGFIAEHDLSILSLFFPDSFTVLHFIGYCRRICIYIDRFFGSLHSCRKCVIRCMCVDSYVCYHCIGLPFLDEATSPSCFLCQQQVYRDDPRHYKLLGGHYILSKSVFAEVRS